MINYANSIQLMLLLFNEVVINTSLTRFSYRDSIKFMKLTIKQTLPSHNILGVSDIHVFKVNS